MGAQLNRTRPPAASKGVAMRPFPSLATTTLGNGTVRHWLGGLPSPYVEVHALFPNGLYGSQGRMVRTAAWAQVLRGAKGLDTLELLRAFDRLGVRYSSTQGKNYSGLRIACLPRHLVEALGLLRRVLSTPTFPEEALGVWQRQQVDALRIAQQETEYMASSGLFTTMLGAENPYHSKVHPEDYKQVLREQLVEYAYAWVGSGACLLFACGPDDGTTLPQIDSLMGEPWGGETHTESIPNMDSAGKGSIRMVATPSPNQEQCAIALGRVVEHIPDLTSRVAAEVAVTVLGGYMGSRLMQNLRETHGFTYGISARLVHAKGLTLLLLQSQVGNKHLSQSVKEIGIELRRLIDEPLGTEELSRVKSYMAGRLDTRFDGVHASLLRLKESALRGYPADYASRWARHLLQVDPEAVQKASMRLFDPERFILSVAGGPSDLRQARW